MATYMEDEEGMQQLHGLATASGRPLKRSHATASLAEPEEEELDLPGEMEGDELTAYVSLVNYLTLSLSPVMDLCGRHGGVSADRMRVCCENLYDAAMTRVHELERGDGGGRTKKPRAH